MYGNFGYPQGQFGCYPPQNYNRHEIDRVNGRASVMNMHYAPNSSYLMIDENEPVVWLVTTDSSGFPTATDFEMVPRISEEQKIQNGIDERLTKLETSIGEIERMLKNAQSVPSKQYPKSGNNNTAGTTNKNTQYDGDGEKFSKS